MEPKNNQQQNLSSQTGHHQNALPGEIGKDQRALNESAHEQAEKDIEQDVDFSVHSPNDDLDEGETSRLGEDMSEII